jgi:hypothetical protein
MVPDEEIGMTSTASKRPAQSRTDAQLARVAEQGSARHPHLTALLGASGPDAARDLADAVHLLCSLYGRHPALVDVALSACKGGPAREWLAETSTQFERERLYLVRLASAVGPLPSTPGAAQTENALQAQRHAVETLARSEREGCALGAATALIADWSAIRPLLDRAAARAGLETPLASLPGEASIARVVTAAIDGVPAERALYFGTDQLLLQHRALFDLLEARASARFDC